MDSLVLYPSLFVGFVLILLYLVRCHRHKRSVNLAVMTNAVLTGSGIVCGILLIIGSFNKKVMDHLTGINVYIFIAGVAVCYVSAETIYKDILQGRDKDGEGD
jgi:hypothetical protein